MQLVCYPIFLFLSVFGSVSLSLMGCVRRTAKIPTRTRIIRSTKLTSCLANSNVAFAPRRYLLVHYYPSGITINRQPF